MAEEAWSLAEIEAARADAEQQARRQAEAELHKLQEKLRQAGVL